MRNISALALSALAGSQSSISLVADVWRGGLLLNTAPLPVASWKIDWDITRQVHGQASLTIADDSGALAPWGLDDNLGVGGSRVHLRYIMGQIGEEVNLGWFRIVTATTSESWRIHPTAGVLITSGALVDITADELTWQITEERFMTPESPKITTSVFGELARILDGIVPLGSTAGIVDRAVPAAVVYTHDRINAVEDLASSVGALPRMSENGLLDLVSTTPGASVWTIAPANVENGVLIDLRRSQDAAALPNATVVEGTAADGSQLIGRAYVTAGALTFGGPHGRIPAYLSSPIMDTQAKVDAAAATFLSSSLAQRRTLLPITCLPNPSIQGLDVVTIVTPVGTLIGQVQTVSLAGNDAGVQPMVLGVSVGADQLASIATAARRARS